MEGLPALINSATAVVVALAGLASAIALLVVRIEALSKQLNGRLDQVVTEARVAGHAEGVLLATELTHALHRDVAPQGSPATQTEGQDDYPPCPESGP